jgi:dTDP-4-dehydrorhamnose 3,5-epimerase
VAEITEEKIAGVYVVTPVVHGDSRGRFVEVYRRSWIPGGAEMVQGNRSERAPGAVVGLHYHLKQADYWSVVRGRALVGLHDLRVGSPSEGMTVTLEIDDQACRGVYIPRGVAHGFAALEPLVIAYLVDRYYDPTDELGVAWDDPALGIDWRVAKPILSKRDLGNPRRGDLPEHERPRWGA